MQSFSTIPSTEELTASRSRINDIVTTLLSCNSGTAFPTANLQAGMFCYRTDQKKLYELTDTTNQVWTLVADLSSGTATAPNAQLLDGYDHTAFAKLSGATFTGAIGQGGLRIKDWSNTDYTAIMASWMSGNDYSLLVPKYSGNDTYVGAAAGRAVRIRPNANDGGKELAIHANYLTYAGHTVWHAGNDGAGSYLDADMLDGYHASNFLGKNGTAYYEVDDWLELNGAYGLYSTINSAHFYPNTLTNWAPWAVRGNRSGWGGFNFHDQSIHMLVDPTNQGFYDGTGWLWRFNEGVLDIGTVPWASVTGKPSSFGSLKQVVSANFTTLVSAQIAGWTNITGFSRSITMTGANKVLVTVNVFSSGPHGHSRFFRVLRNGVVVTQGAAGGQYMAQAIDSNSDATGGEVSATTWSFIDTPGAGTHTYQVQWAPRIANYTHYINRTQTLNASEGATAVSSITLMEFE